MPSALTRLLDPSVPSNRFILIVTPAVGAIAGLVTLVSGDGFGAAVRHGISAGGVAFLAWAIGRELDHDHPLSAGVAALTAPWSLLLGVPDLLGSALVLLAARLVAGTTGRVPIGVDAAVLVIGAGLVATRPAGPAFVAAGVLALALVSWYEPAARRVAALAATAMPVAGVAAAWWADRGPVTDPPMTTEWIVLGLAVLLGLVSLAILAEVVTPADAAGAIVHRHRIRWARAVALAAGVGVWVWIGGAGVAAAAAPWAALATPPIVALGLRAR